MIISEEIIDRYEAAVASAVETYPAIEQYLPSPDSPTYFGTLIELLRIRMEHQLDGIEFRPRHPGGLEQCVSEFPELRNHSEHLSRLAFEEFRLRRAAGEWVNPQEYQSRWQVNTSDWQIEAGEYTLNQQDWQAAMDRESQRSSLCQASPAAKAVDQVNGKFGGGAASPLDNISGRTRPATLICGQLFGPFRVLAELGRGALARVYLAQQLDLSERLVVLKVCSRATHEPQKIAQLQHPNIVQILSLHEVGNYQVLCMPYAGATTLADIMKPPAGERTAVGTSRSSREFVTTISDRQREIQTLIEHTWPTVVEKQLISCRTAPTSWRGSSFEQVVCEIMLQVAQGLMHAHERGIVHSDLKPANVLLGDDGQARLVDFNVSQQSSNNSRVEHIGGTLPYMAPEHLESLRDNVWRAGPASDLYSLGVMAYQLLSGQLPFRSCKGGLERMVRQMLLQQATKPPPLSQFHVSPDVCSIIDSLMHPTLERRYQSAYQLCEDLQRHLQHLPLKYAANRSLAQRCKKWIKRHPKLSSAASIGTVATVAIIGVIIAYLSAALQLRREAANHQLASFQQAAPELFVAAVSCSVFPELRQSLLEQVRDLRQQLETSEHSHQQAWRYLQQSDRQRMSAEILSLANIIEDSLLDHSRSQPVAKIVAHGEDSLPSEWRLAIDGLLRLCKQIDASNTQLQPDARVFNLQTAIAHYNASQIDQASQTLQASLDDETRQPAAWMLLGHCYTRQGDLGMADQAYASGLAQLPKQWRGWYSRGLANLERARISLRREDYALANECLTRTLELRPTLVNAYFNRALCREQLGLLTEAVADGEQVLHSGTLGVRVQLLLARLNGKLGLKEARAKSLQAAYEAQPESAIDFAELGASRIATQPAQALADLEHAHRLDGRQTRVLQNLAYLTMEVIPDPVKARRYLDAWVTEVPASPVAVASRGVFLARQGQPDAAFADASAAAKLNPTPRETAQIASIYALLADSAERDFANQCRDKAMQLLAGALQLDWKLAQEVISDADLKRLSSDDRFGRLLSAPLEMRKLQSLVKEPLPKEITATAPPALPEKTGN